MSAYEMIKEGMEEALKNSRDLHLKAEEIVIYLPIDMHIKLQLRRMIVDALMEERSRNDT